MVYAHYDNVSTLDLHTSWFRFMADLPLLRLADDHWPRGISLGRPFSNVWSSLDIGPSTPPRRAELGAGQIICLFVDGMQHISLIVMRLS